MLSPVGASSSTHPKEFKKGWYSEQVAHRHKHLSRPVPWPEGAEKPPFHLLGWTPRTTHLEQLQHSREANPSSEAWFESYSFLLWWAQLYLVGTSPSSHKSQFQWPKIGLPKTQPLATTNFLSYFNKILYASADAKHSEGTANTAFSSPVLSLSWRGNHHHST